MGQRKIVIVDDDPDIVESMKVVLESAGYSVETASNGTEGLELIKEVNPHLVIMDVMMNSLQEGFIVSRELKSDPNYKHIPILMVTSVKDKTGIDFESAAGDDEWLPVEGYFDKPVKPQVLLEKVKSLLHES